MPLPVALALALVAQSQHLQLVPLKRLLCSKRRAAWSGAAAAQSVLRSIAAWSTLAAASVAAATALHFE